MFVSKNQGWESDFFFLGSGSGSEEKIWSGFSSGSDFNSKWKTNSYILGRYSIHLIFKAIILRLNLNSGLYFVQDENISTCPLLPVGSGYDKKVTDPDGQKSTDPDPHPCQKPLIVCITTLSMCLLQYAFGL